jgi:hypothetical protein
MQQTPDVSYRSNHYAASFKMNQCAISVSTLQRNKGIGQGCELTTSSAPARRTSCLPPLRLRRQYHFNRKTEDEGEQPTGQSQHSGRVAAQATRKTQRRQRRLPEQNMRPATVGIAALAL